MNLACFTIVAKNYIGLAKILEKSLKRHNPDVNFHIFVSDETNENYCNQPNIHIGKQELGYNNCQWTEMSFKYDLTEFCTAIKPAAFQYLFDQGYDKVIYFDPDIYIFSSLNPIFEILDSYSVCLTPQIAGVHIDYEGELPEWAMNVNGIFNLGFCAMRKDKTTDILLKWWRKRLINDAFIDRSIGDFTDQKWMDWVPGFIGSAELYVSHNLGMNLAPWNYFERKIIFQNGEYKVSFRNEKNMTAKQDKLIFVHFAGYDYAKLKVGFISRKRIGDLNEYKDIQLITNVYRDAIKANAILFDSYIKEPYTYAYFDNGKMIQSFHRRLYNGIDKSKRPKNPFSTSKGSFYYILKSKGMISAENLDRFTQRNMPNMDKKRHLIALLFKILYRLMGYRRYVLFVKSLYNYCRPELHTFLINK